MTRPCWVRHTSRLCDDGSSFIRNTFHWLLVGTMGPLHGTLCFPLSWSGATRCDWSIPLHADCWTNTLASMRSKSLVTKPTVVWWVKTPADMFRYISATFVFYQRISVQAGLTLVCVRGRSPTSKVLFCNRRPAGRAVAIAGVPLSCYSPIQSCRECFSKRFRVAKPHGVVFKGPDRGARLKYLQLSSPLPHPLPSSHDEEIHINDL